MKVPEIIEHAFGFFHVNNKPSQEELREYYEKKYYQEENGNYRLQYDKKEIDYINAKISQKFAIIKERINKDSGDFLDIGCGEGFTLNFFLQHDWKITGLDFSSFGCDQMNPDCAKFLITGDIFENIYSLINLKKRYDVIWLSNVLEHVIDPVKLLKDCTCLIKNEGILIVQVPNDFSRLQEFLKREKKIDKEYWISFPDHLSYFTKDSLVNCASNTGWDVIDVLSDFPVDWFIVNEHSNYILDRSKGKEAHQSKLDIELLIHEQGVPAANEFYRSLANINMGRQITAFLKKKEK